MLSYFEGQNEVFFLMSEPNNHLVNCILWLVYIFLVVEVELKVFVRTVRLNIWQMKKRGALFPLNLYL